MLCFCPRIMFLFLRNSKLLTYIIYFCDLFWCVPTDIRSLSYSLLNSNTWHTLNVLKIFIDLMNELSTEWISHSKLVIQSRQWSKNRIEFQHFFLKKKIFAANIWCLINRPIYKCLDSFISKRKHLILTNANKWYMLYKGLAKIKIR